MKKCFFTFLLIFCSKISTAQSYIGFLTDNYAGVHSVINNPANIADSRYRADINLASLNFGAFNDFYKIKVFDLLKDVDNFDFNANGEKNFTLNNKGSINFDALGPSFMFNINQNNSIALFTRARIFVNALEINGGLFDKFDNQDNIITDSFKFENQNSNFSLNRWAEFGLTYAFVLVNKENHFFKVGLTGKYLYGLGSAYFKMNNVGINYNDQNINIASNYTFTGNLETGNIGSYNEVNNTNFLDQKGSGIAGDIGFVYEFRPSNIEVNHPTDSKYRVKVGFSLTDIGTVRYEDGNVNNYDLNKDINGPGPNGNVTQDQFENQDFNTLFTKTLSTNSIAAYLPTALHLNLDLNINQKFYVNLNTDYGLISSSQTNASFINNLVSLTPRYERKWFSAYLPLTFTEISGFQAGLGFRAGPLFVGSGSIISNLASKTGFADIYAGLKLPIFKRYKKDEEPKKVEPTKTIPVEEKKIEKDSDGDGVLDNVDKCPRIAGERDNNGCPWPDTDKDGTLDKDDSCVNEAGPKENKGCPWKDSDGDKVLDKDDKCPDTPGLVENNGCPKINNDIVKKLNAYSKSVLFDNGKSTIKKESYNNLNEMVEIMNEYPNSSFAIEGYTDSSGKAASNLKLSASRAKAIKDYLISKGINENRLSSKGFGSKLPVASNKTAKGRAQNRRVEIKLAN